MAFPHVHAAATTSIDIAMLLEPEHSLLDLELDLTSSRKHGLPTTPLLPASGSGRDLLVHYPDGGVYVGDLVQHLRHGRGRLTAANGFTYDGDFRNDVAEGFGQATYPEGHRYEGEWRGGQRCGLGELSTAGGDVYMGEWRDDAMHGQGRWTFPDGSFFEGAYEAGARVCGSLASADGGDVYTGQFQGSERHGEGHQVLEGLWQYKGEWRRDKRHGHGECRFFPSSEAGLDAGGCYCGAWAEDCRSGWGRMRWPSGEEYKGMWEGDTRQGKGSCKTAQGDVYTGEWDKGQRQGQGRCVFANGNKYEGSWQYGLPHGRGTMQYADGDRYTGDWVEGRRQGVGSALFADGTRFTGAWEEDAWVQSGADPRLSRVSGPGISRATAGHTARFTIEARDDRGNKRLSGGDQFLVSIRARHQAPPARALPAPLTPASSNDAGLAPPDAPSTPPAAAAAERLGLEALSTALAAAAGGRVQGAGGRCGAPGGTTPLPEGGGAEGREVEAQVQVQDLGTGRYDVMYRIDGLGVYELWVEAPGAEGGLCPVADSPFLLRVLADEPCIKRSQVEGGGCRGAVCGRPTEFRVQLRDQFGNPCSGTKALQQLPVQARLSGGSAGEHTPVALLGLPSQGTFMGQYTGPATPGRYRLELFLQDPPPPPAAPDPPGDAAPRRPGPERHLPGSPFSVLVAAPAPGDCGQGGPGTGLPAPAAAAPDCPPAAAPAAVLDLSKEWQARARAMYAEDGDEAGWSTEEEGEGEGKGGRLLQQGGPRRPAHEQAFMREHPEVPVVERLEDLWRLGRFQAMQKRKEAGGGPAGGV